MKVFMAPRAATAPNDNGIGRVVHAMERYLPEYGVHFSDDPNTADVRVYHAGTATPNDKQISVLINHGLYWSDLDHFKFSRSNNEANQRIVDAARRARIITVPSNWVAEPFRRDMLIEPEIVGHGIDVKEWTPGLPHGGYILWNKNRPTDVCDPSPAWRLAEKELKVVSTFGPVGKMISRLHVAGQLPFEKMKPLIEGAELYLATTPETFGIGTLEAMTCSIPILGCDWCGTSDLVRHKETGWLVHPGDIAGLYEGALWLKEHRKEIGANAREFALGYDWPAIIHHYYDLFKRVEKPERPGLSIIITNHNYGNWVGDAIRSCLWQQVLPDEIIVVDDGSTDESLKVLKPLADQKKIKLLIQENQGVAAARNNGIRAAHGPLLICLDADDMLGPEYVQTLKPAMERDRGIGVAYTGVKYINPESQDTGFSAYRAFTWEIQARGGIPPATCIPSGSMFRKSMWERAGGYRQKYAPGEDTEFWVRGLSVGFTAEMITPETMFWYRGHLGSASRSLIYTAIDDDKPWMRDKMYPMGAPSYYVPNVRSYLNPLVSVIIPVGPGHEGLVEDAIRSVMGQTIRGWELVLVDDTGGDGLYNLKRHYPFLKVQTTTGKTGAGAARNLGILHAQGKFVLFLDADDWLRNDCIDLMLQAHVRTGHYVFSDFYAAKNGATIAEKCFPYNREMYLKKQVMHSVTALVPIAWAREVKGFDPSLPGWEEYDFYMKMAVKGYCGVKIEEPLFTYRITSGTRRKISQKMSKELNQEFARRFEGVEMASCCGNAGETILEAKRAIGLLPRTTQAITELPNEVRLEFTGAFMGPVGYQVNGRTYYGARDDLHRFINAPREDVDKLVSTGKWRIILPPMESSIRPEMEPVPAVQPAPLIRQRRG